MIDKNFSDLMICPKCNSNDNTYIFNTDEIEFSEYNNTGHYYADCHCEKCNTTFRVCMNFKYKITENWVR